MNRYVPVGSPAFPVHADLSIGRRCDDVKLRLIRHLSPQGTPWLLSLAEIREYGTRSASPPSTVLRHLTISLSELLSRYAKRSGTTDFQDALCAHPENDRESREARDHPTEVSTPYGTILVAVLTGHAHGKEGAKVPMIAIGQDAQTEDGLFHARGPRWQSGRGSQEILTYSAGLAFTLIIAWICDPTSFF
jgi:hypothetical protein